MKKLTPWWVISALALGVAPVLAAGTPAHAHVHGAVQLDIALDGPTLTITLEAPLDSVFGFEHAPRTAAEKKTAQDALATLRTSGTLFVPDAAAGCTFKSATADSEALHPGAKAGEHADLDASAEFTCAKPEQLRRIDLGGLLDRFPRVQRLQAQIVTAQGQFKQTLQRPARVLTWGR
ncbi:DUF2796 domain-containing protein [Sphaerotilus sp.]|uniref:DUF2796 domain-containing protein n=1 Tax=Sphaerotilus sp. TaxID=2093942 RepID=UPI00286E7561|nr:DUF2796 domain-containing protein [Sphaerotilus sp.]